MEMLLSRKSSLVKAASTEEDRKRFHCVLWYPGTLEGKQFCVWMGPWQD